MLRLSIGVFFVQMLSVYLNFKNWQIKILSDSMATVIIFFLNVIINVDLNTSLFILV